MDRGRRKNKVFIEHIYIYIEYHLISSDQFKPRDIVYAFYSKNILLPDYKTVSSDRSYNQPSVLVQVLASAVE